eukprot:CAMPEP_0198120068 /NCGR_PEP_ID=MMETSP1442-20131203/27878_1 /TAXON_ID= /ORGANISM="Craspedostauros australis, Strain CCMP3328" /LENGTH=237 /DNA_ID=CAMNT_0043778661 /DNA_START=101 /DNA_END=814 /DNA_ORIENTATION=-
MAAVMCYISSQSLATPSVTETFVVNATHGTRHDFYYLFHCDKKFRQDVLDIPTHDDWVAMRKVYAAVMKHETSASALDGDGFHVPIYVDIDPVMQRSVYAKERIPKGTVVWTDLYEGAFERPEQYRIFLINMPRKFACEMLYDWTYYLEDKEAELGTTLYAVMDDSALINSGRDPNKPNVVDVSRPNSTLTDVVATRDIEVGEQLLADYKDCRFKDGEKFFGMKPPKSPSRYFTRRR